MKKNLLKKSLMAFALLFAFAVSASAEDARLLSFGFSKANNPGLSQDYVATVPELTAGKTTYDIEVALPAGTDLTALVATFTVNEGNTVTVDGAAQTSGVTKNDFTDPVDYLVRNSTGANNVRYTITVVEASGAEWTELAVYDGTEVFAGARLAINPEGEPYIAFKIRKDDNNKMSVLKFNGASWEQVGAEGFSGQVNGSHYAFDIAPDGTPYVAYGDQEAESLKGALSVMKFDGSKWDYVGGQGFFKVQAQYVGIAALENGLAVGLQNNSKTADIPQRALGVATWDGSAWTTGESSLLASGQGMYTAKVAGNGKVATMISINRGKVNDVNYGHNIFKYENGQWESLATNFLEEGATQTSIAAGSFGTTVALDGTIYAWTGDDVPTTGAYQVRLKKYDAAAKTWITVTGNTLPLGYESGLESHVEVAVAIATDGTPFVAYRNTVDLNNPKLYVMYLDPATNQWSTPQLLAEGASDVNIKCTKKSECYVTYTDNDNHIHLFRYCKESGSGITAVKPAKVSDNIFNLQGMRVNKAGKGLYIINGKKVIK